MKQKKMKGSIAKEQWTGQSCVYDDKEAHKDVGVLSYIERGETFPRGDVQVASFDGRKS